MKSIPLLANKKAGMSILGAVVLGILIILVLSYFNVSIKSVVESPTGKENINYVREGAKGLWGKYLAGPASYLWKDVWLDIFWQGFINNMERIRDGKPTIMDESAPEVGIPQR